MSKKEKFYITTPIFYASGNLHLGHAYTAIATDILARWNRNLGKDVFFLTGSDEHGQKVVKNANENNLNPLEFVDGIVKGFQNTLLKLNISNDYFIRTTNCEHKKFVQKMLQKCFDNGDIYKAKYAGLYCTDCERYYKEDELIKGKICPDHKRKVDFMEEENYFFRLLKYQDRILKLYENNPNFLSPTSKSKETINRVLEGLCDISISRNKKSLSWGIELPFDKDHVTYVWFDALFNYISALDINNKLDFWPANVQIIGKDIMWFHNVFWPAFLMSCELKIPTKIFAHGFWTVNGEKMGKSMNNVIDPIKICEKYGVDEFRYFLMSAGSFGDDLDFSNKIFTEKINNELNNDLGNLVSRVHSMTKKYFNSIVPEVEIFNSDDELYLSKLNIFEKFNEQMQALKFNLAIDTLWCAIRDCNAYINCVSPWKETNKKRLSTIIVILVSSIKMFGNYIDHIMPKKAEKLREQYNFKFDSNFKFEIVKGGHKLFEKNNLFEKIILKDENSSPVLKRFKTGEKNKIKNLIFDFDGVICDSVEAMHKVHCESFGNIEFEAWKKLVFSGNPHDVKINDTKKTENYLKNWRKVCENLKLEKNIRKELNNLSKKYDLFIISSNSEKNLSLFFENNNFINIFKKILGFETDKSKVKKFEILFDKHKINTKNSIFITDSLGDILDANKVKIKTIAVDFGVSNNSELEKGKPFKIVSKFREIRKTIEKLNLDDEIEIDENKKEGFSLLNLKVGEILSVKQHPEAEKLFIEEIDLGEDEPRQIVSGLSAYYKPEEMLGKKVIVVCNLKPAKLRGVKSEGMVLVSENCENKNDIKLGLLLSNTKIGTNLCCNGKIANNTSRIKIDEFFKMDFKSDGEKVYFDKKEVLADKKLIKVDRKISGIVC